MALSQLQGLPSGAAFPIGTTGNIYEVVDGVGLSKQCAFNVTVNDPGAAYHRHCRYAAGPHSLTWNALEDHAGPGIYFIRLQVDDVQQNYRLVLMQ